MASVYSKEEKCYKVFFHRRKTDLSERGLPLKWVNMRKIFIFIFEKFIKLMCTIFVSIFSMPAY